MLWDKLVKNLIYIFTYEYSSIWSNDNDKNDDLPLNEIQDIG